MFYTEGLSSDWLAHRVEHALPDHIPVGEDETNGDHVDDVHEMSIAETRECYNG